MGGPERNAPCPCGSGVKYNRCCGNVIDFPNSNLAVENEAQTAFSVSKQANDFLTEKKFDTLEEINQELGISFQQQNSRPIASFLGLSPNQISNILYQPTSLQNEIFKFVCVDDSKLLEIPIIAQALYFLNRLRDAGELKATQKGNLPRSLVVDFYHNFFSEERYARLPSGEDDLPQATRIKHLLDFSGYIKKRHNKYSLTKKGAAVLSGGKLLDLFENIFINFTNKWNWAYCDLFSDLSLIQSSAIFNLYLIHKKAQDWTLDKELGRNYLEAFPDLVYQAGGHSGPEQEIINCFAFRFLEQTGLPWGLVDSKEEGKYPGRKVFYKTSTFFNDNFIFLSPNKN